MRRTNPVIYLVAFVSRVRALHSSRTVVCDIAPGNISGGMKTLRSTSRLPDGITSRPRGQCVRRRVATPSYTWQVHIVIEPGNENICSQITAGVAGVVSSSFGFARRKQKNARSLVRKTLRRTCCEALRARRHIILSWKRISACVHTQARSFSQVRFFILFRRFDWVKAQVRWARN